jgi:ABC-type lipoprotein export system ATPase subunit
MYTDDGIDFSTTVQVAVKVAPAVCSHFVMRQQEWDTMAHHLITLPSKNQKIFCITGMGGCGKTQLVSYFLQEKGAK